ncbi:MAG: DUF1801 domain-containing protein [Alphaproteobacteria bacterium]|nr:DUF1801 domain-containing protein [Alphaproteobacteria bacterium]
MLMQFPGAVRRDPAIEAWFAGGGLRPFVQPWFATMRGCGADVRELLHDGHPIACVGEAAFGYVDAFAGHANVGFFMGSELDDPAGLLLGTGKRMRHVKLRWGEAIDQAALTALVAAAYRDMKRRLKAKGA